MPRMVHCGAAGWPRGAFCAVIPLRRAVSILFLRQAGPFLGGKPPRASGLLRRRLWLRSACHAPRTVTIEEAAAQRLPFPPDRKYPLPEIQNPNLQSQGSGGGGGGDMRSTMAFMLLAVAVFFGYQFFFAKPKPDQQPPAQTQSQAVPPSAPARPGQRETAEGQSPNAAPAAQAPATTPQISASLETYTTSKTSSTRLSSPIVARRSKTGF